MSLKAVLVHVASLSLLGCACPIRPRRAISRETQLPIPGATLYIHTSIGNIFDRNQYYWICHGDGEGRFDIDWSRIKGRVDGAYVFASGFYPTWVEKDGVARLQAVKGTPLPILKGKASVSSKGDVLGFSFSKGNLVKPEESDLVLVCSPGMADSKKVYIEAKGGGGLKPIESGIYGYDRSEGSICAFVNATEAPEGTYEKVFRCGEGPLYVRCRDSMHFAKIYSRSMCFSPDGSAEVYFDYVYQPDASRLLPTDYPLSSFDGMFGSGARTIISR